MSIALIANLFLFVISSIESIYGFTILFKEKKPLYLRMVCCAVICVSFQRLFIVAHLLVLGDLSNGFNVSMLGLTGCFMFFLSANYGQMDGLVDDKSDRFSKTRTISLLAPLLVAIFYAYYFACVQAWSARISTALVFALIMPSIYYNFKHIIIYDVDLGIISSLRVYNVLAVLYAIMVCLEYLGKATHNNYVYLTSFAFQCIIIAVILPVVKRGVEKWTM